MELVAANFVYLYQLSPDGKNPKALGFAFLSSNAYLTSVGYQVGEGPNLIYVVLLIELGRGS